jgi:hypothetical protein
MKKMPPFEKVYEAFSAIADGRIVPNRDGFEVASSGSGKKYVVTERDGVWSSSDSATYWQGYPGYPIIAALLLRETLPLKPELASRFAGIDWTDVNKRHKRNYAAAAAEILQGIRVSGYDTEELESYAREVYTALEALDITVKRGSVRPPKG